METNRGNNWAQKGFFASEGHYRVCDAHSLHSLELGWTLIESFVTEKIEYDGSGLKVPLKRLEFLMFKPREVVESEALEKCDRIQAMLYAERDVLNTKNVELEKWKRDYLALEKEHKKTIDERQKLFDERNALSAAARQLELDIAKIRKALGDMRMQEIIGSRDK